MRPDASNLSSKRNHRGHRSFRVLVRRSCPQPYRFSNTVLSQTRKSHLPPADGLCESKPLSAVDFTSLTFLHCNLRGWISHHTELEGYLKLQPAFPSIICLNETLLSNKGVDFIGLTGYEKIARRDRDEQDGGGIAVFALSEIAHNLVLLYTSLVAERVWILIHSDFGPYLLCCWYRLPSSGEIESIQSLRTEYLEYHNLAMGTFIIGDVNVHQLDWLRFSSHNSREGAELKRFCEEFGFEECVKAPTRDGHLLDLFLTDASNNSTVNVIPGISDYSIVTAKFDIAISRLPPLHREVWDYKHAAWDNFAKAVHDIDWRWIDRLSPDEAAELFTKIMLDLAKKFIPTRTISVKGWTHAWFNERCLEYIRRKQEAFGRSNEKEEAKACSEGLLKEYELYIVRTRDRLSNLRNDSKAWWKFSA